MKKNHSPHKPWEALSEFKLRNASHEDSAKGGRPFFSGEWPSLTKLFDITSWRFPDRLCFAAYDPGTVEFTYRQASEKIGTIASWLMQQGLKPGDRVAVSGKNSPEWAIAYLAVLYAGGVVVPIDYGLHLHETENLLKASGSAFLFVDTEKFDGLDASALSLRSKICLEPGKGDYILGLEADHAWEVHPRPERSEKDLAAILYTSGTTGNPKGVMLTHGNLVSDCFLAQSYMPLSHEDVFYALLPIHHSYTMLAVFIEAISVGAAVVFGKKMVTSQILKDLKQGRVTMFLGVPLLFNKVLAGIMRGIKEKGILVYGIIRFLMALSGLIKKATGKNPGKKLFGTVLRKASLDTIRICISGGGPLAPATFRAYNQLGLDFVQGYGLTETSPILTLNPVWRYKETSVGSILPGVEMKILSPDGEGRGEIAVKGPMVMQGYYRNQKETDAVLDPDGWLKTGDVGWIDEERYVYLTGRAKNLIVTEGGKNVFPEEIENEFQLYPEVEQVMVRGYILDAKNRSEGIEVLLYPAEDSFRGEQGIDRKKAENRMHEIVNEINARLHVFQKMTRVTVLDTAMEMTTTKKIRRHSIA